MKSTLLPCLLCWAACLPAQTFTESPQAFNTFGVTSGASAFADVDGDGDNDLVIAGENAPNVRIAKLFTNDNGTFNEVVGTPFTGVSFCSLAFSDVDGDGDSDLLITGENSPTTSIAKLYKNEAGSFSEVPGTPFEGVVFGSPAFSDVDGDGDQDLLLTGLNIMYNPIAKLYANDGAGNFSLIPGASLEAIFSGTTNFSDIDGDGDEDLLLTGGNSAFQAITKLFTNDGLGNFSEVPGTPFTNVLNSAVAFSDVDGDGDSDVLIMGTILAGTNVVNMYLNEGGVFTELAGIPFDATINGSVAFADVDGDSDPDVLITGAINSSVRIAKLYANNGGVFTEVADLPFTGVGNSTGKFADIDGDGDSDVLITGQNAGGRIAKLYRNGLMSSIDGPNTGLPFACSLYPNPAKSNAVNITYQSTGQGRVIVHVYDINQRLVANHQFLSGTGEQSITLDVSGWKPGLYRVRLTEGARTGSLPLVLMP